MQTHTPLIQADKSQMQQLPDISISFVSLPLLLLLFSRFLSLQYEANTNFPAFLCKRVNKPRGVSAPGDASSVSFLKKIERDGDLG